MRHSLDISPKVEYPTHTLPPHSLPILFFSFIPLLGMFHLLIYFTFYFFNLVHFLCPLPEGKLQGGKELCLFG